MPHLPLQASFSGIGVQAAGIGSQTSLLQYSPSAQVMPWLLGPQVMTPLQPLETVPHLPAHAVAGSTGVQSSGSG